MLAVGAGVYGLFVAPAGTAGNARLPRRLLLGAMAGALLLLAAGPLDIATAVGRLLGRFESSFFWQYLQSTRHGSATLYRTGLAVALPVTLLVRPANLSRLLFVLVSTLLLATFSWTSHSAAMGGNVPLLADLVHFGAAGAWAGSIMYAAWSRPTKAGASGEGAAVREVGRLSALGLWAVLLLFGTGIYLALLHLTEPAVLTESDYGRAFIVKLVFIAAVLAVAAFNRFWLVPAVERGERLDTFRNFLRGETLLLLGVIVATAVLTTSSLPHEPGDPTPLQNLQNFLRWSGG